MECRKTDDKIGPFRVYPKNVDYRALLWLRRENNNKRK